ncbi:MAG: ABC transporter ATP-binding protein [Saprospirales bacterium]|nr:ABC transporter ATP-binding protein [Saprospirales bacterium]MBK8491455.1 ABC transporter ATP-binding protein [Saprospirales bacterium]
MFLQIRNITKSFGTEQVLQDLSLDLEARRMCSILGRSGSGKTTLLKIIAGLEGADRGSVWLDSQPLDPVPAHARNVVYLYQEALLFPHLNVSENVAFGLRLRREAGRQVEKKVGQMLEELELTAHARKRPDQLSGGQRQRVAFGRALIVQPRLLLLDEPFGALDTETRQTMQSLLKRICGEHGITALFVTHDLKEAIRMGDVFGWMQGGRLKTYPGLDGFLNDSETGIQDEIAFWKSLYDDHEKGL